MSDDQKTGNPANNTSDQRDDVELPTAEDRTPGYFPAAEEVCPRCHAQDYIPIRDAQGRDQRHCVSCGLDYLPGQPAGGNGQ
jgi:hypothetical protein